MTGLAALPVVARLAAVPRWVWGAGAGALALGVGACVHERRVDELVERMRADAIAQRDAEWNVAFGQMRQAARQWRTNYENKAAELTRVIGEHHAQDLRDNRARSDDLLLRGPGKAAAAGCGPRGDSVVSAASGGPVEAAGRTDAPMAPMPADEPLAILPWGDLVRRSRAADDDRSEVEAWRRWYAKQKALHDGAVDELGEIPGPAFGGPVEPR